MKPVTVVGSFRSAQLIVDTPMRKIELLEALDGRLVARATEYVGQQAHVLPIWMEHHEAVALAKVIMSTEGAPDAPLTAAPISNHKDIIVHAGSVQKVGDYLECAHCGDLFKVRDQKQWMRDLDRAIKHCKRYHPKPKTRRANGER